MATNNKAKSIVTILPVIGSSLPPVLKIMGLMYKSFCILFGVFSSTNVYKCLLCRQPTYSCLGFVIIMRCELVNEGDDK